MKTIIIFTLATVTVLSVCPKTTHSQTREIDPELQRKIDDYIQLDYLPNSGISGIGLAIVRNDGELLYTNGYGPADMERRLLNGNQTQFQVASITKSFTSVVAVKLLSEKFPDLGETVLDTPIKTLLPESHFTLSDRFRSEYVTFRDLLAHRVCLFKDDLLQFSDPFDSQRELAYHQRYTEETCGLRTDFQYNDQMYAIAGILIEDLAEKPYEDTIHDLLNELGMTNTTFLKETDDMDQMPFRVKPYYVLDGETFPMNPNLLKRVITENAGGGLLSTPNDMSKYMRFRLNLGELDGRQIVPENVMQWLAKPSQWYNNYNFKVDKSDEKIYGQYAYGLGLSLGTYDGFEYNFHGGNLPPYTSLFSLYPAKNLSIYTSTNMGPVGVNRMILHATLVEILEGNDAKLSAKKLSKMAEQFEREKEENSRKASKKAEDFLSDCKIKVERKSKRDFEITGIYGSGSLGEIEVSEKFNEKTNQTQYYFEYGKWYTGWLEEHFDGGGFLYLLNVDTDAIQDSYAVGDKENIYYIFFHEDTLNMLLVFGSSVIGGSFKQGLRMDQLPAIPWSPDSCGPQNLN